MSTPSGASLLLNPMIDVVKTGEGMAYKCNKCGGSRLQVTAWIWMNTEELAGCDAPTDTIYCADCNTEVGYEEVEDESPSLSLPDLIDLADRAYNIDNMVRLYSRQPNTNHGDGLAKFVADELADTFDSSLDTHDKLVAAITAVESAVSQLQGVVLAFQTKLEADAKS